MANTSAIKRGWHYDPANSRLDVYVDGTLVAYFDGTNALQVFNDTDIQMGDNDKVVFGDASGGDVRLAWDASQLEFLPATDNTGSINIGDGTTDIDFEAFMGETTKYVLFDNSQAIVYFEDTDLQLGDNDKILFGDAVGGDVRLAWDASQLEFLPATDSTGAVNIGDGSTDMDFKWFGGTTAIYVTFDVSQAIVYFEDADLQFGDNDKALFGDAVGGDVRMSWDGSRLSILPATDDTGMVYIGSGGADIDFRVYTSAANYAEVNVGQDYFNLVGLKLYAPNLATSGSGIEAGHIYVNSNGYLIQAD